MQKTKKAKKAVSKKAKEEVKAEEAPAEEAQMDTDDDEKAEAKIVAADGDIKPKRKATKTAGIRLKLFLKFPPHVNVNFS